MKESPHEEDEELRKKREREAATDRKVRRSKKRNCCTVFSTLHNKHFPGVISWANKKLRTIFIWARFNVMGK